MITKQEFWKALKTPPTDERNCLNCVNGGYYDCPSAIREGCGSPHFHKNPGFVEDGLVDRWKWNGEEYSIAVNT